MTNFLTMDPYAAVRWFDENRTKLGLTEALDNLGKLIELKITDTELMLEFADSTVLDDLAAVPGLEPTVGNLRKLAVIGPDVMRTDPENVDEWISLATRFADEGDDPIDVLMPYLEAGRGTSFARQMLDLFERTKARTGIFNSHLDASDLDLTQPYATLADMVEAGVTEATRKQWAAAGFDLADLIKLTGEGLDLPKIAVLKHHGIPRERWTDYVRIPIDWLATSTSHGLNRETIARDLPDGIGLDLLAELAAKGWQRHRIEVSSGRYGRFHPQVWEVYFADQTVALDAAQIRRLLDAKLTSHDVTGYYVEARTGAASQSQYKDQPDPLLIKPPQIEQLDEFLTTVLNLAAAKVRKSHLATYRWVGCRTFEQILEAAAAGISETRAKQLRATYGRKVGWSGSKVRRIDTLQSLLEHDQEDRAAADHPAAANQ